ncbi:DUF6355 family natural product biosynthesis protein [Streptomyces sp. UNOC14_S4]|uniref:DUF6355 family natural product biosynthesis protein n=1 Tax=Streptomyces sp. UNOC14_S4 TaxID=2872340 RepID=UPI001E321364|nr:DUF6355 family natural product biosynthesis protein [Streptomyces sp. UNOC14_S4]MCC3767361.1 hypothetical protein [Streptomyces sp. UNOC14_S4]
MRSNWARAAAVACAVVAMGSAATTAYAAPETASVSTKLQACGWDPDGPSGRAYYNHCTSDGSWIYIRVEFQQGGGTPLCVAPGRTYLGLTADIKYAWYTGGLC